MGGLTAVGQAGSTPPAMIIMDYKPKGTAKDDPIILVGKAITFDTGGYSIKVGGGMQGMKYDKCGGMAIIGAMKAVVDLKIKQRVVAIIATAENMVDTDAYRVDDIITMYNGVTVEVTNTDAEGRLVLGDGLAYGCKHYTPKAIFDMATLTGGVVVAFGGHNSGVFCEDDNLRKQVFAAADLSGEKVWQLPLWDEHRDMMKSNHADICNSSTAGRGAHPIQGAAFLSYFAAPNADPTKPGEIPWAHIDIAGIADTKSDGPIFEKGPTGYGVSLLARTIEEMK